MTDELTLREKVLAGIFKADNSAIFEPSEFDDDEIIDNIAAILEDTGSPAHMRVAAELRGE